VVLCFTFFLASNAIPSLTSHTCSSTSSATIQGTITLANTDKTALTAQTDTIANTLTSHVQSSCASNSKSQVSVNTVTQLNNGDLEVAYTCSGVSNHTSAQSALNTACQSDAINQTVSKCSSSSNTGSGAAPKSVVTTTQKAAIQTSTTTKTAATQTSTTTKKAAQSTQPPVSSSSTTTKTASVDSHSCSSTDSSTVQGIITLANADKTALTAQINTIANALTSHVQSSCASNSKSQVSIDTVNQLDNGNVQVAYTCSGVSNHSSAQSALNTACQSDTIKQTINKCSSSVIEDSIFTQKSTGSSTEKAATQASITVKQVTGTITAGKRTIG